MVDWNVPRKFWLVLISLFLISNGIFFTFGALTITGKTKIENLEFGSLGLKIVEDEKLYTAVDGQAIISTPDFVRSKEIDIKNTGTLPGRLYISILDIANGENGCTEAEIEDESKCNLDAVGELGRHMLFEVYKDGKLLASTKLDNESANSFADDWKKIEPVLVSAKSDLKLNLVMKMDGKPFNNEIQSDQLAFDIEYRLDQME